MIRPTIRVIPSDASCASCGAAPKVKSDNFAVRIIVNDREKFQLPSMCYDCNKHIGLMLAPH